VWSPTSRRSPRDLLPPPAYSLIILFRLPWSSGRRGHRGRALLGRDGSYEVDDLVFDADAPWAPLSKATGVRRDAYSRDIMAQRQTLEASMSASPVPRDRDLRARLGKPALVHPNLLPRA